MSKRGKAKPVSTGPDKPVSFRDRLGLGAIIGLTVLIVGWTAGVPIYGLVTALLEAIGLRP